MKTGPRKPLVAPRPANRMSSRLPASSSFWRLKGMLAIRLVSRRGAQKESRISTSRNGTGWSLSKGGSAPAAGAPVSNGQASRAGSHAQRFVHGRFIRTRGARFWPAREVAHCSQPARYCIQFEFIVMPDR